MYRAAAQDLTLAAEFAQQVDSSTLDDFTVKIYGDSESTHRSKVSERAQRNREQIPPELSKFVWLPLMSPPGSTKTQRASARSANILFLPKYQRPPPPAFHPRKEHRMSDTRARGRRTGGREGRRAARLADVAEKVPFITRALTPVEVLSEEGLATIEHNADTILETVGIDFRGGTVIAADRVVVRDGAAEREQRQVLRLEISDQLFSFADQPDHNRLDSSGGKTLSYLLP